MSDQDLEQKFVECTRGIFDEKRQVQVIEATRNLATAGRVDDLIDLIRVS
jgi:hypothetical protein